MKRFLLIYLVFCCFYSMGKKNNKRPNVIIVITDDQGKNDLGCEGNSYIQTPNLDRFYDNAIRLDNFHVSTTCAPSRGALMTGRHTNRLNVFHTIGGRSLLFEDEITMGQVFASNGYTTGMFGKWHLGDNYPFRPEDRGFQEVVRHGGGGISQAPDYWGNDYFDDTYYHNGKQQQYKGYCTDVFFEEAINFIDDNKDEPFLCYLSTNAPHGPRNCPIEYIDKYKDQPKLEDKFKRFYGMISNIDDNFKRLIDYLEENNLRENTILIFMTDNGTAGGNKVYSAGMKGAKGSQYEGGHRVPFYIQWPQGKLKGGQDIENLTAHYDVLPTLMEMCDVKYNFSKKIDGKSFRTLLYDSSATWSNRILYVDKQRESNLVKNKDYAVMDNRWRLVNGNELYDINEDLGQKINLYDKYPEVVGRLNEGYNRWWQSLESEGVDRRFAYIKVGTRFENPTALSAHDLLSPRKIGTYDQTHCVSCKPGSGIFKVSFEKSGRYRITLSRFPIESDLRINQTFPKKVQEKRIEKKWQASTKSDFEFAKLDFAQYHMKKKITSQDKLIYFELDVTKGNYDLSSVFEDKNRVIYPAYYTYIEKL
ncbi:arylsulfatase [Halosquirtibacter xylanolyticus]|uniref:arylsulfatase n=1 Tax=Halosquirtibacter xylanolyticus TaxID=3374599 RepID=UPI003749158C|nr:arylsulfatase [Prolixibacteraceae bacterium]